MFTRKSPAERHFDQWASQYDRDLSHFQYMVPRVVFDYLAPHKTDGFKILDIGIGTGLSSQLFRHAWPDAVITGVDISERMLKVCRDKGIADHLCRCDAGRGPLPFTAGCFDAVICAGVLEYISNPKQLLDNINNSLEAYGVTLLAFETPETTPIYKARLLTTVTHTSTHTRITRLNLRGMPRVYSRYLYEGDAIANAALTCGLHVIARTSFTAYKHGRDIITYELLVLHKKPAG
jgi:predicted TPR repeat methyltransferase